MTLSIIDRSILGGMGDDWWKTVIDVSDQHLGPLCYEKGSHGGPTEPGYLASCYDAIGFASSCRDIGLTEYKMVHRYACQHFGGKVQLVDVKGAGHFGRVVETVFNPPYDGWETQSQCCSKLILPRDFTKGDARDCDWVPILRAASLTRQEIFRDAPIDPSCLRKIEQQLTPVVDEIEALSKLLGLESPIAQLQLISKNRADLTILLSYLVNRAESLESIVEKIFEHFKRQVATEDPEKKLKAIAWLYQALEWLHPFPDGQGRTDLILLSTVLSQHGFHPVILRLPYISSFTTLEQWVIHLKKGLVLWEEVRILAPPRGSYRDLFRENLSPLPSRIEESELGVLYSLEYLDLQVNHSARKFLWGVNLMKEDVSRVKEPLALHTAIDEDSYIGEYWIHQNFYKNNDGRVKQFLDTRDLREPRYSDEAILWGKGEHDDAVETNFWGVDGLEE